MVILKYPLIIQKMILLKAEMKFIETLETSFKTFSFIYFFLCNQLYSLQSRFFGMLVYISKLSKVFSFWFDLGSFVKSNDEFWVSRFAVKTTI